MLLHRWLPVFAISSLVACGGSVPSTAKTGSDSGVDGGAGDAASDAFVPACQGGSVHSEGSAAAPVVLPIGQGPWGAQVNPADGPSYYRLTGLTIGARYELDFTMLDFAVVQVVQSGSTQPSCMDSTGIDGGGRCLIVSQSDAVEIQVDVPQGAYAQSQCFGITATLDSPAGAFEGATDALRELRFGTPDLPHRGIVDHLTSYYRITQLVSGKRYRLWMTSLEHSATLLVGPEDPLQGIINTGCPDGMVSSNDTSSRYCTFVASGSTKAFAVSSDLSLPRTRYVVSVFEDFDSEGAAGAPLVLPFGAGVVHAGTCGPQPPSAYASQSYYQITGVTDGAHYLVSVNDGGIVPRVAAYTDATFTKAATCTSYGPTYACEVVASGTSLFVAVDSFGSQSVHFTLRVRSMPTNEGSNASPVPLVYSPSFSFTGGAADYSYYTVSNVPAGWFEIAQSQVEGDISTSSWNVGSGAVEAATSRSSSRAILEVGAGGKVELNPRGPGRYTLALTPAPVLASTYKRAPGATAIPNGDANGLLDVLTITGSGVAAIHAVTVEVSISHGVPSELSLFLVAPDGTEIALASANPTPYVGTIFDDYALGPEAGFRLDGDTHLRPSVPLYLLEGLAADGNWSLRVVDGLASNIQGNAGSLLGWGLEVR